MAAAGTAAVSAVHASSASSLDTRTMGQAALQLEQSTANLVLHGGLPLLGVVVVVVDVDSLGGRLRCVRGAASASAKEATAGARCGRGPGGPSSAASAVAR
jgi:hypothetical protein